MKNIAFVNCICSTENAFLPLPGGKTPLGMVLEKLKSLFSPGEIVILASQSREEYQGFELVVKEAWNQKDFLKTLMEKSRDRENLVYLYGDAPLLDLDLFQKLLSNHKKYFAEYTFAEGYPWGLSPEILSSRILPALLNLAPEDPLPENRGEIFSIVQRDINSFDLETEIAPKDLRLLRVMLSCNTRRNTLLVTRILESGAGNWQEICSLLEEKPEILRTLPAYISLQISAGCLQACSYCPYPRMNGDLLSDSRVMERKLFNRIVQQTKEFCDDAVLGVSLWGEPSRHPEIEELAATVCSYQGLSLVVETSGIGWNRECVESLAEKASRDQITWIVSLDALSPELYRKVRGAGMEEALGFVNTLSSHFPRNKVFVQAVRTRINEDELERFYREWKKKTDSVIIQKYDAFSGFLSDLSVADLSPLSRFPCWHPKRDLYVYINGDVPLCREDLFNRNTLGNLAAETLETVWARGQEFHISHCKKDYPEICRGCDEYYTYNF